MTILLLTGAGIVMVYESKLKNRRTILVIPRKNNSKVGNDDVDPSHYKYRYLVENVFTRLKDSRDFSS